LLWTITCIKVLNDLRGFRIIFWIFNNYLLILYLNILKLLSFVCYHTWKLIIIMSCASWFIIFIINHTFLVFIKKAFILLVYHRIYVSQSINVISSIFRVSSFISQPCPMGYNKSITNYIFRRSWSLLFSLMNQKLTTFNIVWIL
jgi:hypothetical protein